MRGGRPLSPLSLVSFSVIMEYHSVTAPQRLSPAVISTVPSSQSSQPMASRSSTTHQSQKNHVLRHASGSVGERTAYIFSRVDACGAWGVHARDRFFFLIGRPGALAPWAVGPHDAPAHSTVCPNKPRKRRPSGQHRTPHAGRRHSVAIDRAGARRPGGRTTGVRGTTAHTRPT